MSPLRLVVTTTSNCSGRNTIWCAALSTMMCLAAMSGYSRDTSSNTVLNSPSVSFMMLALVAQCTDFLPSARASSNASRITFSEPFLEMIFRHCAPVGDCMCSMPA